MGAINVVSAILPSLSERLILLNSLTPLAMRQGARLATVFSGFALFVLATGLLRRKRVAWLLTLGWLVVTVAGHLIKGLAYEEALAALLLIAWLLWLRADFTALSDRPSIQQGLSALALSFVFTLGYGTLGFFLLDRHYHETFTLPEALVETALMFVEMGDPGLRPLTGVGRFFADSIYLVALGTLAYALLKLLMPVVQRMPATPAERERARNLIVAQAASGQEVTPWAHLLLLGEKHYHFYQPNADAVRVNGAGSQVLVAYAVHNRVALALGDLIGPPALISAALAEWQAYCLRRDWVPALYQVTERYLDIYRQAGFLALCIGQEGIIPLADFSLAGSSNKNFRTTLSRFAREGYTAVMHDPPLPPALLAGLRKVSDAWLARRGGAEMRYSMGWFDPDYLRACHVITVFAPDGRLTAFANLVPPYQHQVAAVDLMRQDDDSLPGTMDFLFLSLIQWARTEGYFGLSLGLSALAGIGDAANDPVAERALHALYARTNTLYNFRGLHAFKQKFHPAWQPRYLIYPGAADLPGVLIATVLANSGQRNLRDMLPELWSALRNSEQQSRSSSAHGP